MDGFSQSFPSKKKNKKWQERAILPGARDDQQRYELHFHKK